MSHNKLTDRERLVGHDKAIVQSHTIIIDQIEKLESQLTAAQNEVARLKIESQNWREIADKLFDASGSDTSCDEWNLVYAEYGRLVDSSIDAASKPTSETPCPHCLKIDCECSELDVLPEMGDQ